MSFSLFKKKSCETLYDKWKEFCLSNRISLIKQKDTMQLEKSLKSTKLTHNFDQALDDIDLWLSKRSSSSSRYTSGLQLKKFIYEQKIADLNTQHAQSLDNIRQRYCADSATEKPVIIGEFNRICSTPSFTFNEFQTQLTEFKARVAFACTHVISNRDIRELQQQLDNLRSGLKMKIKNKVDDFKKSSHILQPYANLIDDLKKVHVTQYTQHQVDITRYRTCITNIQDELTTLSAHKSHKKLNGFMCLPLTNMMIDFDFVFDFITEFGNLSTLMA